MAWYVSPQSAWILAYMCTVAGDPRLESLHDELLVILADKRRAASPLRVDSASRATHSTVPHDAASALH